MKRTLRELVVEYGVVGVVVYLIIFFAVWAAFLAAIRFGWKPSSTAASVGVWTASYIATKITQPLRFVATVALTPLVARWYERTVAPSVRRLHGRLGRRPSATPETDAVRKPDSAQSTAGSTASPPADA